MTDRASLCDNGAWLQLTAQPEDVANAYLWLASHEASLITGATINVNGEVVIGT